MNLDNNTFFNPPPGLNPNSPGRGNMPPSPPPNFIPDAPIMDAQPFGGSDNRSQFRSGAPSQSGNVWRCINRFTFIWLINGRSFWFYPVFVSWQHVEGFRWVNGRWEFDRINLNRILFFRCF